jgi:hypothetical protein
LDTPSWVSSQGSMLAITAPRPMKKPCMAKPIGRCFGGSWSPT